MVGKQIGKEAIEQALQRVEEFLQDRQASFWSLTDDEQSAMVSDVRLLFRVVNNLMKSEQRATTHLQDAEEALRIAEKGMAKHGATAELKLKAAIVHVLLHMVTPETELDVRAQCDVIKTL